MRDHLGPVNAAQVQTEGQFERDRSNVEEKKRESASVNESRRAKPRFGDRELDRQLAALIEYYELFDVMLGLHSICLATSKQDIEAGGLQVATLQ